MSPSCPDLPGGRRDRPTRVNRIQLFNGKDLTGWTPNFKNRDVGENYKNTFRVVDGLLTVSYDDYESVR